MANRPPFEPLNHFHQGFRQAAARSRLKYRREEWGCEEAQDCICEELEREDETIVRLCLECRTLFSTKRALRSHKAEDCWAVESQEHFPKEWTPALWAYVRAALDPENRERSWRESGIVKALKHMISSNYIVRARWETLDLPQHIEQPYSAQLVYADVFKPRNSRDQTPKGLFKHVSGQLFKSYRDSGEILVYTDGSCPNNGQYGTRGGCAYVVRCSSDIPTPWKIPPGTYSMHGALFFRLEEVGPTGLPSQPTSNRAELRAVVAALRCIGPGNAQFEFSTLKYESKLVVATDSTYVVDGATRWSKTWEKNGWKSSSGDDVKNRDLWEVLLARVRVLLSEHCAKVSFWHITRDLNGEADRLARYAATLKARPRFGIPGSAVAMVELSET